MSLKGGLSAVLLALAAFSGTDAQSGTCGGFSNVVATATGDECVCQSGYFGTDCLTESTCPSVKNTNASLIDTDSLIPTAETKLSTDAKSVQISIFIPMMANRTYVPDIKVQDCDSGVVLQSFAVVENTADNCMDTWELQLILDQLVACGFNSTDETVGSTTYAKLNGSITYQYEEYVQIGAAGVADDQKRTVQVLLPVSFSFKTNYEANLTVNDLKVYANVTIDFGLTGSTISPGSTTSPMTIAYAVQYPYEMNSLNPQIKKNDGSGNWVVGMATEFYLPSDLVNPLTGDTDLPDCSGSTAGTGDYTEGDLNSCLKELVILWYHGSNCYMNGEYQIEEIRVACGVDIAEVDCPLTTELSNAKLQFTLNSENFCPDEGSNNVINNAVNITSFLSPPTYKLKWTPQDGDTLQKNAHVWGDVMFMRFHFSGMNVTSVTLNQVSTMYSDASSFSTADPGSYSVTGAIDPNTPLYSAPDAPAGGLGLDIGSQAFLFQANALDASFLGGSATAPPRGTGLDLTVNVKFTIGYSSGRRRRRQASSGTGGAVSQLPPQTVQSAEAEAAPSSAIRVAPAVAVAIALVSAVAFL